MDISTSPKKSKLHLLTKHRSKPLGPMITKTKASQNSNDACPSTNCAGHCVHTAHEHKIEKQSLASSSFTLVSPVPHSFLRIVDEYERVGVAVIPPLRTEQTSVNTFVLDSCLWLLHVHRHSVSIFRLWHNSFYQVSGGLHSTHTLISDEVTLCFDSALFNQSPAVAGSGKSPHDSKPHSPQLFQTLKLQQAQASCVYILFGSERRLCFCWEGRGNSRSEALPSMFFRVSGNCI